MKQMSIIVILFLCLPLYAVTTQDIEAIRLRTEDSSSEVQAADRDTIEEFWETSINTMLLSDTAQDIVAIQRRLEEQLGTKPLSFFASAYISAAKQSLQSAFVNVTRLDDPEKRQLLEQNLMILTAKLQSPALADIAIARLGDEDPVVRYWAAKAITNFGVIQMLSSEITSDQDAKEKILNALKERIPSEQQAQIQMMIVTFAASIDHPAAREILLAMADQRIKAYKNWSFDNGEMDAKLLIAIANIAIMQTDAEVQSTFARQFAELYSLPFQAYMQGQDFLTDAQMEQILTVILEVDKVILGKLLNVSQTGVLRAVQTKVGVERQYETIFGDRLRSGDLGTLYKFDYGKDASGKPITEPPAIGEPPASMKND